MLGDGRVWRDVRFLAQASPARPLATHLRQFGRWAVERKDHLGSLTIAYSHTENPGFQMQHGYDWFPTTLAAGEWEALLGLLRTLGGAPQLAQVQLQIHALPPGVREDWEPANLPASALQLPALEELSLSCPLAALAGSLTHLSRLHTLRLAGVTLPHTTVLPASLTALHGSSAHINEWSSVDAIVYLPDEGAPGLRVLAIHGGLDEQGQRQLVLNDLHQLSGLTSLSLEGTELHMLEDDFEEEEEEGGEQLAPPLREMARLTALQRLELNAVSGIVTEGQPVVLPRWPALRVRLLSQCLWLSGLLCPLLCPPKGSSAQHGLEPRPFLQKKELVIWSVDDWTAEFSDLRISGLPALQAWLPCSGCACCRCACLSIHHCGLLCTISHCWRRWRSSAAASSAVPACAPPLSRSWLWGAAGS